MTDLFTTPTTSTEQSLADAMAQSAREDYLHIIRTERVMPWVELEFTITKDEIAFLRLIEDHGGYVDPGTSHVVTYGCDDTGLLPVSVARQVDHLTYTLGFIAPANARAMVNRCIEKEYVIQSECALTGRQRWDIGEIGRYFLELKAREDWFSEDRE